jgi:RpiR family transcriptional regulator, carbohydrate utilization regulator
MAESDNRCSVSDHRQQPLKENLRQRVNKKFHELRPSEQAVASHLRSLAGQRFDQSITELAKAVGVSEATVSRVSRALGFSGFADMKLSMATDEGRAAYPNIPAELQWSDTVVDVARKLSTVFARSLADTQQTLENADLEKAVEAILSARRVVFMGVGGAGAICEEAAHIFLKIGIDATSYSDGYTQTIIASTLPSDCLVIAVSHTGATPTVVSAVQSARQNGVRTIAITGHARSALGQAADIVFATTNGSERAIPLHGDFLEGRISQLYLVDVLYIAAMFRLNGVARERLAQTTRALAKHYGTLDPLAQTD